MNHHRTNTLPPASTTEQLDDQAHPAFRTLRKAVQVPQGASAPLGLWSALLCAGAGGVPVGKALQLEANVTNETAVLVHRMGGSAVVGHVGVVQDDTHKRAISGLLRPGSEPSLPPTGLQVAMAALATFLGALDVVVV
ncbi:hypothetical protein B484DRAFT_395336 [Ochromonadaceae sp. CCMP2298]|nr:hypothetical protein B484DRAFT_395336 [Ochromonadaceae sp. CCMP2298]